MILVVVKNNKYITIILTGREIDYLLLIKQTPPIC
jgi:hypothetical protein